MIPLTLIVFPKVTELTIREIGAGRAENLGWLTFLALAAFFVQNFANTMRIRLNNIFEQKVIFDLRSDLYAHIQRLPLRWFDNRSTGDVMTRLMEDVTSMERVLIDGIEIGVVATLQIAVVATVCFFYNVQLTLWALLPIPILFAGAWWYTTTAHRRYRLTRQASSAMNSLLHDNLAGIRQIKTYAREEQEHARFNTMSRKLADATLVVMRAWSIYNPSMEFVASCGLVLVIGFGGRSVLAGQMSVGELTAFLILIRYLYEPISRLHQLNQLFQAGRAAAERVFEILDTPLEPDAVGSVERKPNNSALHFQGDVRYENICFSYEEDRKTLCNISFHARPGMTVALVGTTGAGKSTLINLLPRFYEYDSGEIYIDGRPIREIPKEVLRQGIGLVTQESFLFNGTLRDNLRFGKPDATEEEMIQAARDANALPFIERLPEGLDTVVGERGIKLSVGEKQRISIARALLKDPPILILDEATASVDTETERQIQQALDRLMERRTSFVIAHRLSTVRHADLILVLDRGEIVERGTHETLLAQNGIYTNLCRHSFLAQEEEAVAT